MKVDKTEIDYDRLLDDWADIIYVEADRHKKTSEEFETGSYRRGYYAGLHAAYIDSLARISLLENRKAKRYMKDE